MSVRSAKMAVTWENPLRDSERVLSRPGMPASAVSMRSVTCFSISAGDSAGAVVLTCTCLLVMSGTASIGNRVNDRRPSTTTHRVAHHHDPAALKGESKNAADHDCALIFMLDFGL